MLTSLKAALAAAHAFARSGERVPPSAARREQRRVTNHHKQKHQDRSKYRPHQGKRECARRRARA